MNTQPDSPNLLKNINTLAELRSAALEQHQAGNLGDAKELYRLYLQRAPQDAMFWSNLGALFRSEKKYEVAAACQRRALQLNDNSVSVINNAANALYDVGTPKKHLRCGAAR